MGLDDDGNKLPEPEQQQQQQQQNGNKKNNRKYKSGIYSIRKSYKCSYTFFRIYKLKKNETDSSQQKKPFQNSWDLITNLFEVWFSNGSVKVLCPMY